MLQGDYESAAAAKYALPALGNQLQTRTKPWVRSIASIQNNTPKQVAIATKNEPTRRTSEHQTADSKIHTPYHQSQEETEWQTFSDQHNASDRIRLTADSEAHIPYHQHIPYDKTPDGLKLHNLSKRHKQTQKANSATFSLMTNLNYKSQDLSNDFTSKGKDSATIGAV